jgi:hypothetical protein
MEDYIYSKDDSTEVFKNVNQIDALYCLRASIPFSERHCEGWWPLLDMSNDSKVQATFNSVRVS